YYVLDICYTYANYYHNIDLKDNILCIKNALDICINIDNQEIVNAVELAKNNKLDVRNIINNLRLDALNKSV
ncbi:MAG: hypothetical protein RLZZ210_1094, partial [Pseudomonadota bacterium]